MTKVKIRIQHYDEQTDVFSCAAFGFTPGDELIDADYCRDAPDFEVTGIVLPALIGQCGEPDELLEYQRPDSDSPAGPWTHLAFGGQDLRCLEAPGSAKEQAPSSPDFDPSYPRRQPLQTGCRPMPLPLSLSLSLDMPLPGEIRRAQNPRRQGR